MKKADLKFFENYINTAAPTGYECEGQKVWLDFIKPYIDEHHVDNYGTVYGVINPEAEFKVVIEAHADEISWYISYIDDKGFMYVKRNGGSDHMIAPSKRVNIHTKKGFVSAVFGWPAIHTRGGANAKLAPTVHNITLDCGATSKQEVLDMGIHVGSVITYKDEFFVLNDKYAGGKSLDNKAGGVVIALVTKMLSDKKVKLPFGLYIVNAVQEEVGLRGAQMITETIKPNVAIVTDVAHDTNTPLIDKKIEGDFNCGDGPILTYGPAVHNKLLDIIIDAAEDNKISFQRDAASRATGTDTDAFAYSNGGVPSALISFPMRYMHTTVEMVALTDVEDTVKLIFETLKKLTPETNFKYL